MEADNIDPQQRMALELTWEALEHARIPASALRGESVGVYIGSSTNDYSFLAMSDPSVAHPYAITGTASSIIANRVSYFYDFRGPSIAVDTACSSSLVAAHQGVQALRSGEADVVLVGGVNALITPLVTVGFDEVGGVLAPDGRIKSFSQDADGYARSEGGGMLVLKRVADARRDGDEILAVIAGSAVNHDGRSNGLLAPNPDAQAEVLRKAYKDAGIDPRTVDYIEAHGTGTILGDPIEADALGRVVGRGRAADRPALLGAVKSNVGHLESAAGAASLAKMTLALKNDKLPPSINYSGPNPYIDFDAVHLKVADTVTDWPRYSGHAIAGVSGFGFGGANAHLVLREVLPSDLVEPEPEPEDVAEGKHAAADADAVFVGGVRMDEYGEFVHEDDRGRTSSASTRMTPTSTNPSCPVLPTRPSGCSRSPARRWRAEEPHTPVVPLAVSAFLTSRKKAAAAELADWMDSEEGRASSLESIGRSLSRRNHGRSRAVVMAHDHDEAIKALRALADGKQSPNVYSADGPVTNGPVWVLAGFGAQHRKMAKSLYLRDEMFADWINKVDALVQDELGYSVVELILDDSQDYGIETTQVTIFAIQIALGELLKAHGAKPGAVVGQSLGEAAAAYFAGGLSLADATRTICSRSHLMGEGEAMLFGEYIRLMALVEYSAEEIKTVFSDYPDLEVCVYAAPTQTVIGGPPEQVDAIIERAEKEGKFARKFQTKGASHTQQMDPLLGELAANCRDGAGRVARRGRRRQVRRRCGPRRIGARQYTDRRPAQRCSRRAAAGGCAGAGSAQARGRGGGHAGNPRRQGAREHRHQRPRHYAAPRRELDERNDGRGVGPGDSRAGDDARRVGGLAGRGRARPVPYGRCRYRAPLRGRSPATRQWRCARRPVDCDRDRQDRCVGERHARFSRRDARLVGAAAGPCGNPVRRVATRGPRAHTRALRQAGSRHRRCAIGAIDRQARRAWRQGWKPGGAGPRAGGTRWRCGGFALRVRGERQDTPQQRAGDHCTAARAAAGIAEGTAEGHRQRDWQAARPLSGEAILSRVCCFSRGANSSLGPRGRSVGMLGHPVPRDVDASRDPDVVVALHVIDETRQRSDAPRPADDASVQADRQHLRRIAVPRIAFGVQRVERIAQIGEELVATVEALRSCEAHVVGVERVRDDEMGLASASCLDERPVRQVIRVAVRVIDEAAVLDDECARARAVAAGIPAGRRRAGQPGNRLDRLRDVLAFDVLGDILVADPAKPVACDLVTGLHACVDDGRIARQRHRDAEDRQRQAALVEQAQHAPDAGTRPVLVQRLHRQVPIGEG